MRVSTQGQTTERQEHALKEWMANHPEYELQDTKVDKQSGRNLNRLDWFIEGAIPTGLSWSLRTLIGSAALALPMRQGCF